MIYSYQTSISNASFDTEIINLSIFLSHTSLELCARMNDNSSYTDSKCAVMPLRNKAVSS